MLPSKLDLALQLVLGVKTNLLSGNLGSFILLSSLHRWILSAAAGGKKHGMMNQVQTVGAL